MASYVIVWENNTPGHSRVSGNTWPGHSAIHIGSDFWTKDMSPGAQNYVSFWPSKGASFSVKSVVVNQHQAATINPTLMDDVESEGYLPDHVIKLPSDEGSENKMKAEWLAILLGNKGKPEYKELRFNCSTVCSRVLHAGGFYAEKWSINNNLVWSPSDIQRLAGSIRGGQNVKWPEFLALLKQEMSDYPFDGVTQARSGCYCTTGAPVKFQSGEKFTGDQEEWKGPKFNATHTPTS